MFGRDKRKIGLKPVNGPVKLIQRVKNSSFIFTKLAHSFLQVMSKLFHPIMSLEILGVCSKKDL